MGMRLVLSDIRPIEANCDFKDEIFRVPLAFGAGVIKSVTSFTVRLEVENRKGKRAIGLGNVLLSDLWGFPTPHITHEKKDTAMREIGRKYARLISEYRTYAHPVDIYMDTVGELERISREVEKELDLGEPIPQLAAKLCMAPVDAALHDAFGAANGVSSYDAYGPEFMEHDLSAYLGSDYRGKYISDYIRKNYTTSLPVFHLVGGKDKLRKEDITDSDPKDGLPVSLDEWIRRDGIFCFKIKLKGNDLDWDTRRIIEVADVVMENAGYMGNPEFYFSVDTNEMCDSPEYMVELLKKLKAEKKEAFDALLYVEQPTERDLEAHRFDMRPLAAIKPVLADEGVTTLHAVDVALGLGWSGLALKTCKGHSFTLLCMAKCEQEGKSYSVQDLTNPGFSLIQSVGLAARINPIMGVEYNSRQYIPWADKEIQEAHLDVFTVRQGRVMTGSIGGLGLGYGETIVAS